jgi:hypothetical protein
MKQKTGKVTLTLFALILSLSSCSRQHIEHQQQGEATPYPDPPFSVSISNDTLYMRFIWEREIGDSHILIHPYREDGIFELGSGVLDVPLLQYGDTLTLTEPTMGTGVWKHGFLALFSFDDPDFPVYGWKCIDGTVTEIVMEK